MEEDRYIDLSHVWSLIKAKLQLIIGITILSVFLALVASFFFIKPMYKSTTSIIIGKDYSSAGNSTSQYTYNEILMYQTLANTYTEIAKSWTVAEKTAEKLNINMTASQIMSEMTVSTTDKTQIMQISVTDPDPNNAMLIANTLTECFITEAARLFQSGTVQVMDKAQLPSSPVSPNPKKNAIIGFAIGIVVSLGIIFLMAYLDDTLKDEKEVTSITGLPVLGVIPLVENLHDESYFRKKKNFKQRLHNKRHFKATHL